MQTIQIPYCSPTSTYLMTTRLLGMLAGVNVYWLMEADGATTLEMLSPDWSTSIGCHPAEVSYSWCEMSLRIR